jgi:two-component system, OmpR family, response regulator
MRLLIIEDDRDAAEYLTKAFREVGHVADLAGDGEEGLALALDGQYDVLIVDRMLPKLDGLTLIGTLRKKNIETPALILSALGQVDDRVKGLRAGGDDYLPKPYSFSWRASKCSPAAVAAAKKQSTALATWNSTGCHIA